MWIDRQVEPLLLQRAVTRPVVVLTGARQTGKTSLMRRLFPEHGFVTLDLPSEAEQAERDPGAFLARHPPPVVVDEVQYAPGLFRHLKAAVDRERGRAGAFLLTGSQPLGLMQSVSDSLAGRAAVVELEPLSFAEAKTAHPRLTAEEFLVRGGFPELYENLKIDSEGFLRSYVATYLERDLRQILHVSNLRNYERFLRAAALRSAQLLNRADLARDVGIGGSTAGAWLSALEASHQLMLLEPWFANRTKSLVKRPKLYLRDAGLAALLCGVQTIEALRASPLPAPCGKRSSAPRSAARSRTGAAGGTSTSGADGRGKPTSCCTGPAGSISPTPSGRSIRTPATLRRCAGSPASCRPERSGRCLSSVGRRTPIRSATASCAPRPSTRRTRWPTGPEQPAQESPCCVRFHHGLLESTAAASSLFDQTG